MTKPAQLLEAEAKYADDLRDARRERDEAIKAVRAMQMERATEEQEREADEQEQKMEYDRLAQELEACQKMVRRRTCDRRHSAEIPRAAQAGAGAGL